MPAYVVKKDTGDLDLDGPVLQQHIRGFVIRDRLIVVTTKERRNLVIQILFWEGEVLHSQSMVVKQDAVVHYQPPPALVDVHCQVDDGAGPPEVLWDKISFGAEQTAFFLQILSERIGDFQNVFQTNTAPSTCLSKTTSTGAAHFELVSPM